MKFLRVAFGAAALLLGVGAAFAQDAGSVVDVPAPFGLAIFAVLALMCSPRKKKSS